MTKEQLPISHADDLPSGRVRLAAVGDILLTPPPNHVDYRRSDDIVSNEIRDIFHNSDLVFGNLEFTLATDDRQLVPTKPRVIGNDNLVRLVKSAGFDVVTLANNHMFDGLDAGFNRLRRLLDEIQLIHFGAGMNLGEASAPAIVERNAVRIAFIGAADHRSGPYQFATPDRWGVAPLDIDRLEEQVRLLRKQADHVIVSLHWGEERFLIPSPVQIEQAHRLVEAGASMILGHHPHVIQGLEMSAGSPIIYSLGNFIADDVYFPDGDCMEWNRTERTGMILTAELTKQGVENVRQVPTYDNREVATIDESGRGERRVNYSSRLLSGGVSLRRYRREHLWIKTVRPALDHLRWSELKHLRPRHFRNAIRLLMRAKDAQ